MESCKLQSIYSRDKSCSQEPFQLFLELSIFLFVWKHFNICSLLFTFKHKVRGTVDSLNSLLMFSLIERVAGRKDKI